MKHIKTFDFINESINEAFKFDEKQVKDVADKIAQAIAKMDKMKTEVHDMEFDKGRGAGFDISMDGDKGDGGSYTVRPNGDVVNSAIGNAFPNAVYAKIGDTDIKKIMKNIKMYESFVNEAKFDKKKLIKAVKKDDGFIQLGNGEEYLIYKYDNGNDDNDEMWGDKTIFALDQDGGEHEIKYSDIVSYNESIVTEAKDQKLAKLFKQSIKASVKDGEDKLYKLTQDWEDWNIDNDDKYDDLLDPLFMAVELVQDAGVPGVNNVEDDKEYRMYIKSAEKHLKQFNKDIAKAMKGLNEGLNNGPRADKAIKDLEKIGAQIDYLSDADDATKKIWKKAGVNTEDDNGNHPTIILYSYVNSWPETKKLLDKSKIKYKELEDPNSAGESFIVFNEGTFIDLRIVNENVNDEIELALTNWLNVLADGNAVAVTDLYLGDGVLLGTVAKDIKQGHTEIQEYFEMFLKKSPIGSIDSFILQNFGDICISDGTYTFEIDGDGGNRESVAARYTYVWKKENKKWMIATHHSSVNP
jgi:uncharacterized protein (TIGR02246 family)